MLGKAGALLNPGAAFSPAAIPGLALWLVGNKSPLTMNGSAISQWDDFSGNGNHAAQGTAMKQPPPGTVNGFPAVDFVGVSAVDRLDVPADTTIDNLFAAGGYVAVVMNADQIKNPDDWERVVAKDASGVVGWGFYISAESGGAGRITFWQDFDTASPNWITSNPIRPIVAGQTHLVEIEYDRDSVSNDPIIRVDGVVNTLTEAVTPVGTATSDAAADLHLGADWSSGRDYDGKIAEVALYSSIPSADEQMTLRNHFAAKYGITLS